MNNRRASALAVALGIAASGMSPAVAAQAAPAPSFNGTYTADENGHTSLWIVGSPCTLMGCKAHIVSKAIGSDWLYNGTQWSRLAWPLTGTCNGAIVPARAAQQYLVPRSDGSLSGAVTATVDCGGATVEQSHPLTLTPS